MGKIDAPRSGSAPKNGPEWDPALIPVLAGMAVVVGATVYLMSNHQDAPLQNEAEPAKAKAPLDPTVELKMDESTVDEPELRFGESSTKKLWPSNHSSRDPTTIVNTESSRPIETGNNASDPKPYDYEKTIKRLQEGIKKLEELEK